MVSKPQLDKIKDTWSDKESNHHPNNITTNGISNPMRTIIHATEHGWDGEKERPLPSIGIE